MEEFHSQAASLSMWIDSIDAILERNGVGETLNEIQANEALFNAEFGQNIDRVAGSSLGVLNEKCEKLESGLHQEASSARSKFNKISSRISGLPERAKLYLEALQSAAEAEKDFYRRMEQLNIDADEFKYLCQQAQETSKRNVIVFSTESAGAAINDHQEASEQIMDVIQSKFTELRDSETYLNSIKDDCVGSVIDDLQILITSVEKGVADKASELQSLLDKELSKEELRKAFAEVADNIRTYLDERTARLGNHEGSLEEQLAVIKDIQAELDAKRMDIMSAEEISTRQEEAGIIVNNHTPETIHTLTAAWEGLSKALSKAYESIEAQIFAEKTAGLTPDQIAEANEVFDEYDRDGGGDMNLQEFHDCCTALGLMLDKDEAARLHAERDSDGSGRIEKNEFMVFYADQLTHSDSREDIVEAFKQLAGGAKYITPQQLSQYFTEEDLNAYLLESMPKAADGVSLDYEAFSKLMYQTSTKNSSIPVKEAEISFLERAGHRRQVTGRGRSVSTTFLQNTQSAADLKSSASAPAEGTAPVGDAPVATSLSSGTKAKGKAKSKRRSWVLAKTAGGEDYYYDDPELGGTGKTQWEMPDDGEIVGEYTDRTAAVEKVKVSVKYAEEWTRRVDADGVPYFVSNTGKSQREAPTGWEEASAATAAATDDVDAAELTTEANQTATVLYDYKATDSNQVDLVEGEKLIVLEGDAGGWTGVKTASGATGFAPTTWLKLDA